MFDFSDMEQNIGGFVDRKKKAIKIYAETEAKRMEAYAKQNRPWTDRTAHARQRLSGYVEYPAEDIIRICLRHGVSYGVDLEYRHEKRYAIIGPTIKKCGPETINGLKALIRS